MAAAQRENVPAQNEAQQMEERNSLEETWEQRGGKLEEWRVEQPLGQAHSFCHF